MERRAFLTTAVSAVASGCLGGSDGSEEEELDPGRVGEITVSTINNRRSERDLDTFEGSSTLRDVAIEHGKYMADQGNLSYVDSQGHGPQERLENAGYNCEREPAQNLMRVSDLSGLGNREAALTIVSRFVEDESASENLFGENRTEHGLSVIRTDEYLYVVHIIC